MRELDDVTVRCAQKKNSASFKALYDFYAPFVWKVAYRTMHGDQQAAEEAVQNTFIRVYHSLSKFGGESALSTWIYRIVYNVCMTMLSKQRNVKMMQPLYENIAQSFSEAERIDMKEDMQKILTSISAEERFLLTGRELLGFSFEELAGITGKSAGSLRTQLSRLKGEIREKFREE